MPLFAKNYLFVAKCMFNWQNYFVVKYVSMLIINVEKLIFVAKTLSLMLVFSNEILKNIKKIFLILKKYLAPKLCR